VPGPLIQEKVERHQRFWGGQGPSLLLSSPDSGPLYDTKDYAQRFVDPLRMWESEFQRAQDLVDWPTDGIPTVRPNLGVIFVPSIIGQGYDVKDDQMPWPGEPLTLSAIRAARQFNVVEASLMRRAEAFYRIHRERGSADVAPYHADTQGVFDIAHLLYGDEILTAMAGSSTEQAQVLELLEISLELYLKATRRLKDLLGEASGSMIHGHGTSQGVFFPRGGARTAEDTATLLSPAMIRRFVMPFLRRSLAPFGGGFVHFCGLHRPLLEELCQCAEVVAIDLGNPEKYDTCWVLERCAASGTVLYSRLPALDREDVLSYLRRLGTLVRKTRARVILRATVQPHSPAEATEMLSLWHELTQPDTQPSLKSLL
jgi:hypothetical protein